MLKKREKMKCQICKTGIDKESGDIECYLGMIKTYFCIWCYTSIVDMVVQMNGYNDILTLEQRINELKEERDDKEI